ncbi:hypothetical protein KKH27_10935 [bacterium]|nr:hypothetical protein [bacterium]MBU1983955.1 hypothetical protein [bacterium]
MPTLPAEARVLACPKTSLAERGLHPCRNFSLTLSSAVVGLLTGNGVSTTFLAEPG